MKAGVNPNPAVRLALGLLAVQAVALLAFAGYVVYSQGLSFSGVVDGVYLLLSGVFTWIWRSLLGSTFATRPVAPSQSWFQLYRHGYPVLLLWRLATVLLLWFSFSLGAVFTVSLVALLVARAAALWVGLQIFVISLRLFQQPLDESARAQLRTWLEYGAALTLITTVMNVWPPAGIPRLGLTDALCWGAVGVLNVAAILAVRAALLQKTKG